MNKKEGIGKYKVGQQVAICGFIEEINIENLRDIENTTHLVINTLTRTIDANPKYETVITDLNKPKPVVPQYVADWYEKNKDRFEGILFDLIYIAKERLGNSILDYDTNNTLSELITKINEWAISHGLDKSNPRIQWMKVTEEVGEIRDVFLRPSDFENPEWSLKDAIGDSIVTLIVLCLQLGYDFEECLSIAYNEIKDREGIMLDDNFVKDNKKK